MGNMVTKETGVDRDLKTWVSVDVIALTSDETCMKLGLISRQNEPHQGEITVPGGVLQADMGETVDQAVLRILAEKAGTYPVSDSVVVTVVSDPTRDERGHTVSIVVAVRIPATAPQCMLVDSSAIPADMPFGHSGIARDALHLIHQRILTDPTTTYALLGRKTSYPQVRSLLRFYGEINDNTVRSRLKRCGFYKETDELQEVAKGRPAKIYRACEE